MTEDIKKYLHRPLNKEKMTDKELIEQKEKEIYSLKESLKAQALKQERRSDIYKRIKYEVKALESSLNTLSVSHCPFCGGAGNISAQYDSDDNRPDGHQNYVECNDCLAQGASFYCEAINKYNLTQEQFIIQEKHRLKAMINAVNSWNTRVVTP